MGKLIQLSDQRTAGCFQTFPGESEWPSAYQTENKVYRFKKGNNIAQGGFINWQCSKEGDVESIADEQHAQIIISDILSYKQMLQTTIHKSVL